MFTKIEDGKVLAKLSDLRLWPKNPRVVEDRDLERLKKQIKELGVYKPLLVTPDGEILGGNMRFKMLRELVKEDPTKYEFVWVSIVEAWTDSERLKYALSDNDTIGKYTREKVAEVLPEINGQEALFEDYKLNFGDNKTLDDIRREIDLTEEQLKAKSLSETLREAGLNEETVDAVASMSVYNKNITKLQDVEIKGEQTGERWPLTFWVDNELDFEFLKGIYGTSKKYSFSTETLLEITRKNC